VVGVNIPKNVLLVTVKVQEVILTIVPTGRCPSVMMKNVELFQLVKLVGKIHFVVFVFLRINVFMVQKLVPLKEHVQIILMEQSSVLLHRLLLHQYQFHFQHPYHHLFQ